MAVPPAVRCRATPVRLAACRQNLVRARAALAAQRARERARADAARVVVETRLNAIAAFSLPPDKDRSAAKLTKRPAAPVGGPASPVGGNVSPRPERRRGLLPA